MCLYLNVPLLKIVTRLIIIFKKVFSPEHAQCLLDILAYTQLLFTSWQQISTTMLLVKKLSFT